MEGRKEGDGRKNRAGTWRIVVLEEEEICLVMEIERETELGRRRRKVGEREKDRRGRPKRKVASEGKEMREKIELKQISHHFSCSNLLLSFIIDDGPPTAVLIDGYGNFNTEFEEKLNLAADRSRPMAVVSIIGAQSTGKSTLLNSIFKTDFRVMDSNMGMGQTTKGIWVAKCPSPNGGHGIFAIDTEGSDGVERGEDVKFENQSALFNLAISTVVIINMKCETMNLRHAGNRVLLQIVFEVMIQKFRNPHKVNLLFILRDKIECPLEILQKQLEGGLDMIWKEIPKPPAQVNDGLRDYFNIKVEALSSYKERREQFEEEVARLREWIFNSTTGERTREKTLASDFAECAKKIWDEIRADKDLDLPSYRILLAEQRCKRIANETHQAFCKDASWLQIMNEVKLGASQGFGKRVSSLINTYLSQYDEETRYYDETKREEIRKQLKFERILEEVKPAYLFLAQSIRQGILAKFEKETVDELKTNGVFVGMETTKFINEFRGKLTDVVIELANWDEPTGQLNLLETEINSKIQGFRLVNELLDQQQRDRREFWLKIASVWGSAIGGALSVAMMILVPGGPAVAGAGATAAGVAAAVNILVPLLEEMIQKSPEKTRTGDPSDPSLKTTRKG
ncbi:hypothetical protein ACH5RR_031690 [Cinchona calisaya]|uniref:GB1/RHD3-type G domain-containing protein n=1 Tax=Cinchona calisaya TaxID=153742 RepID=A0ABD2YFY8_9GENT